MVAIKTLAPEHAQRFETEARAIAALNHPHICVLHDVGPDEAMSPHLRSWYATFMLQSTGRLTEALVQSERVIDEDPLCQMWHLMHANTLCALGRIEEGVLAVRRALELDSEFWFGWAQSGLLAATRGHHDEALHCAEKAMAAAP